MTVVKSFPQGFWTISDIINGYLVTRSYAGFTKREAIKLFKQDTKERKP